MLKKKLPVLYLLLSCVLCLALVGCGGGGGNNPQTGSQSGTPAADEGPTKIDIRFGTISAGGAWQVIGGALLEDIKKANTNITGSILPSTTAGNILGVHQGVFEMAFSLTDAAAQAWNGTDNFKDFGEIRDIRNLAALYPHSNLYVVWANSDIHSIEDLKGKKVSPSDRGSSSDILAQRTLSLYGLSYDDMSMQFLSFSDAAQQMMDRHIDALLFTSPSPFAPVINVGAQRDIRLLSIPADKVAELTKIQGVVPYTLPAGTYKGVDYPVEGYAVRTHIIVRDDFPEDVAYSIVKTIAEKFDTYPAILSSMGNTTLEEMATDVGIPLHPGAERYYRERGWLK